MGRDNTTQLVITLALTMLSDYGRKGLCPCLQWLVDKQACLYITHSAIPIAMLSGLYICRCFNTLDSPFSASVDNEGL